MLQATKYVSFICKNNYSFIRELLGLDQSVLIDYDQSVTPKNLELIRDGNLRENKINKLLKVSLIDSFYKNDMSELEETLKEYFETIR